MGVVLVFLEALIISHYLIISFEGKAKEDEAQK